MTYAGFIGLFLLIPLAVLALALRRHLLDRRYMLIGGALALVALLYMAPWDHTAAVWGLWTWAATRTWGLRWWAIPPEEYLFCIFEALLGVTLTYGVFIWRKRIVPSQRATHTPMEQRPSAAAPQTAQRLQAPQTAQEARP